MATIAALKARAAVHAARALRDVSRIESVGVVAARRATLAIRSAALAAWRNRDARFSLRQSIVADLAEPLRSAMVASHIRGGKRSRLLYQQEAGRTIRASAGDVGDVFRKLMGTLDAQSAANIDQLQRQYQTEALKVWGKAAAGIEDRLRATVSELIASGAHAKEGVAALNDAFNALGISSASDHQLEAIFRTQTQIAYNAGRFQVDQDPAIQEILWGYQYSAVTDDRVRPEHLALDGVRLPKDDPFWKKFWPPNGWNCRCQVIPIFDDNKKAMKPSPPPAEVDGKPLAPDSGFAFHPGQVFGGGDSGGSVSRSGKLRTNIGRESRWVEPPSTKLLESTPATADIGKPIAPDAEQRIARVGNSIAGHARETSVFLDIHGNELARRVGTEMRVEFSEDDLKRMVGRVLVHNHTTVYNRREGWVVKDVPFSAGDLRTFIRGQLNEIRAMNVKSLYRLRWVEGNLPPDDPKERAALADRIEDSFNSLAIDKRFSAIRSVWRDLSTGAISNDAYRSELIKRKLAAYHEAMDVVARQFGIQYHRSDRP